MYTKAGKRVLAAVYAKSTTVIPAHTNYAVPVVLPEDIILSKGRDFMFEPRQLDELSPCAYIVDAEASHVFVRSKTDVPVTLSRK